MIDVGEQITKSFLQFKSTTLSNDVAKDFSSMSAIDSGQDPLIIEDMDLLSTFLRVLMVHTLNIYQTHRMKMNFCLTKV